MSEIKDPEQELFDDIEKKINAFKQIKWSSEVRGEEFNVFALCGVDHYEIIHSKILAEFLSPKGSHGQKGVYLKLFAQMFKKEDWFSDAAIVRTEVSSRIAGVSIGRFDILIEDATKSSVCIIENKIFASEQPEQLGRYSNWIKQNSATNKLLVYLTPDGRKGTTAKDEEYHRLAYLAKEDKENENKVDIVCWLEQCQQKSVELPFVRESLAQYRNHIINILKGGLSMSDDVVNLISKKPKIAQLIYENYNKMCIKMAKKFLADILSEYTMIKEEGWSLDFFHKETGVSIPVKINSKSIGIFVGFEGTELSGFFVGIRSKEVSNNQPDFLNQQTLKIWRSTFKDNGYAFESNSSWPMWKYISSNGNNEFEKWNGQFFETINNNSDSFKIAVREAINAIKNVASEFFKSA